MPIKPTALVILDGLGYSPQKKYNAFYHANAPYLKRWLTEYPHAFLAASGTAVGLLPNTIGSSQAGHMTIGAGRVIPQPGLLLQQLINKNLLSQHPVLVRAFKELAHTGKTLHLMGLLSDAGVHAHEEHLYALLSIAAQYSIKSVIVHAFLDGRDTAPQSASQYLTKLDTTFKKLTIGKLGSVHGRFYAMDRDNNWDRIERSYKVLTASCDYYWKNWHEILNYYYAQNIHDEFIPPSCLVGHKTISAGDGVIFFNFRPDRARELTAPFLDKNFSHFPVKQISLAFFITPTRYKYSFHNKILLPKHPVHETLLDALEHAGKSLFVIAETEKYATVTYFFSGGRSRLHKKETRVLIPSKKAKTYVQYPAMSAPEITKAIIESLTADPKDFYLVNYANADMVGHSGNFESTIKAIECLDKQLAQLYNIIVKQLGGTLYITGDHGNAEKKWDFVQNGPSTAHTTNPVPFIMLGKNLKNVPKLLPLKTLADIAPFILNVMKLPVPSEMRS